MSTALNDVATSVICAQSIYPDTHTGSPGGGAPVDLISGDGGGFATLIVGQADGTDLAIAGKLQESANGSSGWTDIAGATFTAVTDSYSTETISFRRSARYVRAHVTIAGTDLEVRLTAIVGQQRKVS